MSIPQLTLLHTSGSGAMSFDAKVPKGGAYLNSVLVHSSGSVSTSEDLTIKIDSKHGSAYDTVLLTQDLQNLTDYVFYPTHPILLEEDSVVNLAYDNTDGLTFGCQVIFET